MKIRIVLAMMFLGCSQLFGQGVHPQIGKPQATQHSGDSAKGPVQNLEELETSQSATAPATGKFVFNFTVSILTPSLNLPGVKLYCSIAASVFNVALGSNGPTETATGLGSVSGSTGSCSVPVPYSWILSGPPSNFTVDLSYDVGAYVGPLISHDTSNDLGQFTIPASGSVTTKSFNVTL